MARTGTLLPWMLWGRHVRPYALAVAGASLFQGLLISTGQSRYGSPPWTDIIAAFAYLSTLLIVAGWWGRWPNLVQHGLMGTVLVFTFRAAYVTQQGEWLAAGFIFMWAVGSGGAWLMKQKSGFRKWTPYERGRG